MALNEIGDGVYPVATCEIGCAAASWPFAVRERELIERHWHRRLQETPTFFNGQVYIMLDGSLENGSLIGRLAETDFASSLYWRETGFNDRTVVDCFGSAILISADQAMIFGRQAPGHVNSGLCYPPGGFLDRRDVDAQGRADIDASIGREVVEETGLDLAHLRREPGYLVTRDGPLLAIGIVFRSAFTAEQLIAQISSELAKEAEPELEGLVAIRSRSDIAAHPMPPYAQRLAAHLCPA